MLDFLNIKIKINKDASIEVAPDYICNKRITDLMIRGGAFYGVWDEQAGLWSRDEYDAYRLVDNELWSKVAELKTKYGTDRNYIVKTMSEFSTSKLTDWKKYLKSCPDLYHSLDDTVTFSDQKVTKEDYVSKRLPYALSKGPTPSYDTLMSTLYSEEERDKLEWAIGSILVGDSRNIQKFIVLYGEGGTGKSTVLNIVQALFEGYCSTFSAKSLASSNNQFALEQFKNNPLVAIQHDGNLSRIEDNAKLNSLISHEPMTVNEKYKAQYDAVFSSFLFMGTNKPVMITDAKSGLIRRLIDVRPTGHTLPYDKYKSASNGIKFELGAIAQHCIDRYKEMGISYYDNEIFTEVMERLEAEKGDFKDRSDFTRGQNLQQEVGPTKTRSWKEKLREFSRYHGLPKGDAIFFNQSDLLCDLARKESFVIMGRCADTILTNNRVPHISIYINAPFEMRVRRVMKIDDLTKKAAVKLLKKLDKQHRRYNEFYTGREWGNAVNYDLCINSAAYGIEGSVELIERIIKQHTTREQD